jgi:hypothetical protein
MPITEVVLTDSDIVIALARINYCGDFYYIHFSNRFVLASIHWVHIL